MSDGRIGNSNQVLQIGGVVSAPAYSFASDNDTGWYRIGANNIGVAANGAKVLDIATTGLSVTGTLSSTSTLTFPSPFTLGSTSVTTTGTQLNYLNAATGTTGTTSTNLVFSASPTFTGTLTAATANFSGNVTVGAGGTGNTIPVFTINGGSGATGGFQLLFDTNSSVLGALLTDNQYSGSASDLTFAVINNLIWRGAANAQTMKLSNAGVLTINGGLIYGGVTLSNSVTGTGSMVLSASPTLTGTLTAAAANFSGAVGVTAALTTRDILFGADNSYDIGLNSTTSRPRDLWLGRNMFIGGALNYGGVTLSNSVTGTGSMVLSNTPTFGGNATTFSNGGGSTGSRVMIETPASSGGSFITFYQDITPSSVYGIGTAVPGGSKADALIFSRYAGSWGEKMRLDTSGNLGIGMTPTYKLDVTGGSNTTIARLVAGNGSYGKLDFDVAAGNVGSIKWDNTASANTMTYNTGGGAQIWQIASTERMRLDSSGNLGIGTSTPTTYGDSNTKLAVVSATSGTTDINIRWGTNAVKGILYCNDVSGAGIGIGSTTSAYLGFLTGGTERARIGTDGSFLVGTTTNGGWTGNAKLEAQAANGQWAMSAYNNGGTTYGGILVRVDETAASLQQFNYGPTTVGTITTNGSSTSYNTSSDARLKDNIADADDAGSIIDALRVRKWDWKSTGAHQSYGFVAQEEALVYADAVTQGDDGDEIERQWSRDDSKLVPLLVKEIQSLRQRLAALEAN